MPYYSRCNALYGALLRYGYTDIPRLYYARCGAFCCVVGGCLASGTNAGRVRESVKLSGVTVVRV